MSRTSVVVPDEIAAAVLRWYVDCWSCESCGATVPPTLAQVGEAGFEGPSWSLRVFEAVKGGALLRSLTVAPVCSRCEAREDAVG